MDTNTILKNIAKRCDGDVYLGIVGSVRVGKSTFIKEFMTKLILPYIEDESIKSRMIDEMPQAGIGKTIMTTEPKFVPNQACRVKLDDNFNMNVRLVDCVGYVIENAKGYQDEEGERLVKTPWYEEALPFSQAAKIGTQKVMQDHATIGIVITTDGSVTDLQRSDYLQGESQVIEELKAINKPFIVIMNCKDTNNQTTLSYVKSLKDKYKVPVLPINIINMTPNDLQMILKEALYEFSVEQIKIHMPSWIQVLDSNHYLPNSLLKTLENSLLKVDKLREVEQIAEMMNDNEYIYEASLSGIDPGSGCVYLKLEMIDDLYQIILKEIMNVSIEDKAQFMKLMIEYQKAKKEYDGISSALKMVKQTGYGFASASLDDITLSKPELIKQGNRYGVKLKAIAPSIHMIKVDVESCFEPIIGSKQQSEELINYLNRESDNQNAIWESDIFGRKLSDLIQDGLHVKLAMIPDSARIRLQDILEKLVNKGKGNVIAIVL